MRLSDYATNPQTGFTLENEIARISLESNFTSNLINTFRNILPGLSSKLADTSVTIKSSDLGELTKKLPSNYNTLNKKIPYEDFLTYENTLVSTPESFTGDFLTYVATLHKIHNEIVSDVIDSLTTYNNILAIFISNKEEKVSLKDHTALFNKVKNNREKMVDDLSDFFQGKNNSSKKYLSQVISRFSDLKPLTEMTCKLDKDFNESNLHVIKGSIAKSVDLLNLVITDIENKSYEDVSGNAAKNISIGAYEIARYIEFLAVVRYKCEVQINCVIKLVEQLDEIFSE